MRSQLLFAIPLTCILGGLSVLHAYWALGGRRGALTRCRLSAVDTFSIRVH